MLNRVVSKATSSSPTKARKPSYEYSDVSWPCPHFIQKSHKRFGAPTKRTFSRCDDSTTYGPLLAHHLQGPEEITWPHSASIPSHPRSWSSDVAARLVSSRRSDPYRRPNTVQNCHRFRRYLGFRTFLRIKNTVPFAGSQFY